MKAWRTAALWSFAGAVGLAVVLTGAASAGPGTPIASGGVYQAYTLTTDGTVDSIGGTDTQSGTESFSANVSNVSDDGGDSSLDAGLTMQNPAITATGSLDQLDPPLTSPDSSSIASLAIGDSLELSDFDTTQLDAASFRTGVDISRTFQTLACADTDQCVPDDQLGSIDYSTCPTVGSLDGAADGDTAAASGDTLEIVTVSLDPNGTSAPSGTLTVSSGANADDQASAGLQATLIGCDLSGAGGANATVSSDTASLALSSLSSMTATFVFQISNSSGSDVEYKPELDFSADPSVDASLDTSATSAEVSVPDLSGDVSFSADNAVEWQLVRQSTLSVTLAGLVGAGGGGGDTAPNGDGTLNVDTPEVAAGSTGNTLNFDYVPDGTLVDGTLTLAVPDGWSDPSMDASDPGAVSASEGDLSVAGSTITVSNLNMASGDDLTITYGDPTSGPGATASSDVGDQTWNAQEASTAGADLADLASSPVVTIDAVPQITSVTDTTQPTHGMSGVVGDSVVIAGSGFTNADEVTFNGTDADFNVISDTEIDTSVPSGATSGPVVVSNAVAHDSSGTFVVAVKPTISSVTAPNGAVPGKSATISGAHLLGTSEVDFGGVPAITFSVVSNIKITATIPVGAKTGKVTVINPAGSGMSSSAFYIAPSVTGVSPAGGIVGSTVTISGSNLQGSTTATFGGKSTPISAGNINVTGTSLTVAVPSGAATGPVGITNPGGTGTSTQSFAVIVTPKVTSFNPTSGGVGTKVTVSGSGFTGATEVDFNGVKGTTPNVATDGTLTVFVPSGASTGPITVRNAAGNGQSTTNFTFVPPAPTITGISPKTGPAGKTVTINGANLAGATAVTFAGGANGGGQTAKPVTTSATQLTVKVPLGAITGKLTVTNNGKTSAPWTDTFTVTYAHPVISSVSPPFGAFGFTVVVNGSHFTGVQDPAGGKVTIQGITLAANAITFLSDTQIKVAVPATAPGGTGTLVVANAAGSASTTFTVVPTLMGISPTTAKIGQKITLSGGGLKPVTQVKFTGGATATPTSTSATTVTVTIPKGAKTGTVTVIAPTGQSTSSVILTITS